MFTGAPPELQQVGMNPSLFHKSDAKSWRGPCPRCGGTRRFVVFTDRPWPHWNFFCDSCAFEGFFDQLGAQGEKMTPAQIADWENKRLADEEEKRRQRVLKRAEYATSKIWLTYEHCMCEENRAWWMTAGIPPSWQAFYHLGFEAEHHFENHGEFYTRPAYVIPKFDPGWQPTNCDFRLINPPDGVGKYRPKAELQPAAFFTRPDYKEIAPDGKAIICEGSKKAMVTSIKLDEETQVIGLPSCNSWAEITEKLKGLERVWIIFDPDATVWSRRLALEIGKIARVVTLPTKIDDAFLSYGLTKDLFKRVLAQGRPVEV